GPTTEPRAGQRKSSLLWHLWRPTQRTADIVVVPALHLRSPLRHFRLELFFRECNGITKIDEHVRNRAAPAASPVPGISGVFIVGCCVEETNEVNDRALGQERRRIILVHVLLH